MICIYQTNSKLKQDYITSSLYSKKKDDAFTVLLNNSHKKTSISITYFCEDVLQDL